MAAKSSVWRQVRTVLILPGNVLGTIPAFVLWTATGTPWQMDLAGFTEVRFWSATGLAAVGIGFAAWTMRLFAGPGGGTPAPWDPPRKLVVIGPYRHVRNPMIASVLFMLAAEALIAGSWPLAVWGGIFFAGNCVYFPLFEEPCLEKRFGEEYRLYRQNVPRWIPRWTPWDLPG